MSEDDVLARFGFPPEAQFIDQIRLMLRSETEKERASQGSADTEALRALCAQLFMLGKPSDTLLIWQAKSSSMDASASIEAPLMCGAGAQTTLEALEKIGTEDAVNALRYLKSWFDSDDAIDFCPSAYRSWLTDYYADQ